MPFIDVKTSVKLSESQKLELKSGLGKVITLIPGKTEEVTMIGLLGAYDLYYKGEALEAGAYVEVKMYKGTTQEAKAAVTVGICDLLKSTLNVLPENVYITFHEQPEWGANGSLI